MKAQVKRTISILTIFVMVLTTGALDVFAEDAPPQNTESPAQQEETEEIKEEEPAKADPSESETKDEESKDEEATKDEPSDEEEAVESDTEEDAEAKEEEPEKEEEKGKVYTFEDDDVIITATETKEGILPKDAKLVCEKIDEKSDEYVQLRYKISKKYDIAQDALEIIPYDVEFTSGGKKTEPKDSVDIKFRFKDPIKIDKQEDVSVIHQESKNKLETVLTDVGNGHSIKEFEISLDSLSPIVVTRGNVETDSLRSTQMGEGSEVYYISKTSNVKNDGTATSYYGNSQNVTDVVSVDGALYVDVDLQWATESISYDWLYIKDGNDTILTKDADGKNVGSTVSASLGKIGGNAAITGSGSNTLTPLGSAHFRFETDTLKFVWRTDSSVVSYGYYAVITPTYANDPIPDYHFEELEDGTYALVFDKGGDINAFVNRPEIKEAIAEYKNNISEIRLHKDTTSVLNGAFKGLPALKTVTMPRNSQLQTIGKNAFADCDNLERIDIPATVTDVSATAFSGCVSLETVNFASGSQITELPDGIFKSLTALKNVTLPEGLTKVSNNMFDGCTSLTGIDLPDTVTEIGDYAFRNTKISEVPNIDTITKIGAGAFSGCTQLTEVHIPANVTYIGTKAFEKCSNVTDFIFEEGTSFPTLPTYLFSDMTKLKNVTLPSDLTAIPNYCFSGCTSLETVRMPSTLTRIGDYAFNGCSKLKDFEIPPQVKTLGAYAFKSCTSLKDMEIPATVTSIGSGLFASCSGLIKMEFEDGSPIKALPNDMFNGCSKLEFVKLPAAVTEIPSSYFKDCSSLKHVDLPPNLTKIGDYAFSGCYNLEEVELNNGLKTIGTEAFRNCDKLTDIVIPKTVTSIGGSAWRECDGIRSVVWEAGSPMTSLSTYMFYGCTSLEELVLPTNLTYIPDYFARGCTKLSHVDIPNRVTRIGSYAFYDCTSLDNVVLPASCTQLYTYAFYNTGLTHLELPANTTSLGNYCLYNTKLNEIVIPNKVTSIGNYALASNAYLESVEWQPGGSNCSIGTYAFQNDPALKEVTFKEGNTTIGNYAFYNDKNIEELEIPSTVTTIGSYSFYNNTGLKKLEFKAPANNSTLNIDSGNSGYTFANLSELEELVIDRNISSANKQTTNFKNLNPNAHIIIGEHVDTLDNMFVSVFTANSEIEFEGENDFTVSTRIANKSEDPKWMELKGDFYVDPDGVLYKLDKTNNTASVFHIPAGLTSYTVPTTVTSVAGVTYTVNKIESYAVRDADDLTSLTVETPSNVSLPQFSLAECMTLMVVNGLDEIMPEDWAEVSPLCGFPVHSDVQPEQVLMIRDSTVLGEALPGEEPPRFSFGVTISGQETMDDMTYVYPTGMSARMDFAISNESNIDMSDRVIRIYFAFDGDNYTMGNYPVGTYTLVNTSTGARYPFTVHATDASGVYYYDITGFRPGDTLAFNNQFAYLSPKSGGGTMRVWAESISVEEAARKEGKVLPPQKYILAEWYTTPTPYNLTKQVNGNPQFEFISNANDEEDDNIYVRNMSYRIDLTSSGSGGTSYAKDYIRYVDFKDDLKLNENMKWNPGIIEAVRNGDYYVNNSNYVYAKVDGKWVEICHLSFNASDLARNIKPVVVTDDNGNDAIQITWSYRNTYWSDSGTAPTADIPATTHYVHIGTYAVEVVRDSDLWDMLREGVEYTAEESEAMRKVSNDVHETSHYSYSEDQENDAHAADRLVYLTTGFSMSKTLADNNTSFGMKHGWKINLVNSGLIHKTDVDLVTDAMREHYYISGQDMQYKLFGDSKWGPYARVDITSATLCTKPNREVIDIYGSEISSMSAQQSGIDPIPYSGCASTDNSVITASAKLSFYWSDDRSHLILDVKDDGGNVQHSYTIGSGCDYETVQAAIDGIGYVVTYRAAYTVTWDLGDDYTLYQANLDGAGASSIEDLTEDQISEYQYKLKSGRTDTFYLPARIKNTTMWLTADNPGAYPNSSISSSNAAYAKNDQGGQVGVANWSGTVYRELSLDKSASADGKTWDSNMLIPDDTVIDYSLTFTNSGETYDVLPLTDKMTGAQVLIVPVRGNRTALYYPNGSSEGIALDDAELDIYDGGGIDYYVLDKAGTYKGVTIDGRTSDTITVSRQPGSAQTLIVWYFQDVTGKSNNVTNVQRRITYKALANSARLGGTTQGQDGSTVTSSALGNETWLGGHQTHRLYDSLGGKSEQLSFIKWIVEDPESDREDLIRHSLIQGGDEVLYKMIIKNTGDGEVTLTGNRMRDELPSTSGIFPWSDANVTDIYYETAGLGSTVETRGSQYWYIDAIQPGTGADTSSRGLYYIHWTNDFSIHFDPKSEVWIYVKVKFPGIGDDLDPNGDAWDDYITANNGGTITNYFYVDDRQSNVTHELVDYTEGMLQKGVLDTGLARSGYFQSEDTRQFYQNGANVDNGSVQEVAYYTAIYNSGNVRLYLDNLQDQLPKGFKFRSLINCIPKAAETSSGFSTASNGTNYNTLGSYASVSTINYTENRTSDSNFRPVATVQDGNKTITYKNAKVTASVSDGADGKQQVSFNISRAANNDSYLRYDSALGKYYLNPGEAIRFGYICTVEGFKRTENIANNEIAMPVYDKYGLGVHQSGDEVSIQTGGYRDVAANDGGCDQTTNEEETSGRGHTKPSWAKSTTEWFSSNVSLQRLAAVPGLLKTVGGETYIPSTTVIDPNEIYGSKYTDGSKGGTPYVGTVARTSVVNWLLRAYNEGGSGSNSMEDFWIEDTVDAPYRFTGNYFYDYYNVNGTKMSSSSIPIFSLGGRTENDTTVKISTGTGSATLTLNATLTINGPAVAVDGGRAEVKLLRNNDGQETLRIHIIDNAHRIPPNSYMALYAHTQYVSSDAVLSKQFYNHAELQPTTDFDPALVSQGRVLYREDDGEYIPYAIESGASVTMTAGYSSAARKSVTEMGNNSNRGWSDREKNSIQLPEKYSKFYYDLYVDLPKDDPTKKFVLIDSLPEPGDHSPFVDRDMRNSEFVVHMLSENLGFSVSVAEDLGAGTTHNLTHSDYLLEVSTKTEFSTDDWDGAAPGWTVVDLTDGMSEAEAQLIENARSFRLTIEDPDVVESPGDATMKPNSQVHVRFNAELLSPEDADPGAIAWNSFGYRYTVPIGATGIDTTLNAEPLKVGVQIPSVPYINKDLKTPHDHYKKAEAAATYRFLVYSGAAISALNDISEMTMADIAQVLSSNNRDVLLTELDINANEATGRTDFLDEEKKWEYDAQEGEFVPTNNNWIWVDQAKYTVIELPWTENGFEFSNIQHSPVNNYTFTQNTENNIAIRVTNVWKEKGNLKLEKTVNGPSYDPNRKFTFTIHLQDGRYPAYGTYEYVGTGLRDGTITFDDAGNAVVQLKHGQKIEILDIPSEYTYSITESEDAWYACSEQINEAGSLTADATQLASFTNTRRSTTLSVTKRVTGTFGDKTADFQFEAYIVDEGRELNGPYSGTITHTDGTTTTGTYNFVDGAITFSLKHQETITFSGLPVGARYEVDELAASRQYYEYSSTNETGALAADGNEVTYVNHKDATVPTGVKIGMFLWAFVLIFIAMCYVRRRLTAKNSLPLS